MLKITSSNLSNTEKADFELENSISLYGKDWTGEKYQNGYDANGNLTDKEYFPVYSSDDEEEYELIGFEEI